MSDYQTRLFQVHFAGSPDPLMVFSASLSMACRHVFRFCDRDAMGRQLIIYDTTDDWLGLKNSVSQATRRVIERGCEGVAIFLFWGEEAEGWHFLLDADEAIVANPPALRRFAPRR